MSNALSDRSIMEIRPTIFKGIEFIRISELPSDQKANLTLTFDGELIINVLVDDKILRDCIQWKDYISWHREFCANEVDAVLEEPGNNHIY